MASIHAARLERSPRLQRVLELLSDGRWYSTLDIDCRRVGMGRFEYRLIRAADAEAAMQAAAEAV